MTNQRGRCPGDRFMRLAEYIRQFASGSAPATGYIGFGHQLQEFHTLRDACLCAGVPVLAIRTSKPGKRKLKSGDHPQHLLIFQDLPLIRLKPHLDYLFNHCIQPFQQRKKPVSFLSLLPREAYEVRVCSDALHESLEQIWADIYLEGVRGLWQAEQAPHARREDLSPLQYKLDADLDESQKDAVLHGAGPIRVLAPAGSGKTKTLTNRVIHLVYKGMAPESILALAFNKKAADEMAARLSNRGVPVARRLHHGGVVVRTFHGLGYELIRLTLGWAYSAREEEAQLRRLLQQAVETYYKLPPRRNQDLLEPFITALTQCKMDLLPLEEMTVEVEEKSLPFAPVFSAFLQLQQQHKFCNFDDMIYWAVRLLLDRLGLRHEMQRRFEYVLVDEFQDLNRAQLMMMQLLALPQNNLFVVGDDDQMIYGWRGADIRHILEFPKRFANAKDCTLTTNYRSSRSIVRHSSWLIQNNRHRVAKVMHAVPGAPAGVVQFRRSDSLWHQAQEVAAWIAEKQKEKQAAWNEFAVLFRYHAYKYVIAILLDANHIPHQPVEGSTLAQTPVGKDIHAYLEVLLNPESASKESLTRILKRPNKYFTNQLILSIDTWEDLAYAAQADEMAEWMRLKIQSFMDDLAYLQKRLSRVTGPDAFITLLADIAGLREFYQQQEIKMASQDEAGMEVLLDVLNSVATAYASVEAFFAYLDDALRQPPAAAGIAAAESEVHLSTIHAAKGREFRHVVLYNLAWPALYAESDVEEERRVCYVAATRAIADLLVTAPVEGASVFLHELAHDPQFAHLSDRALLKHKRLGTSDVQAIDEELERRCSVPL